MIKENTIILYSLATCSLVLFLLLLVFVAVCKLIGLSPNIDHYVLFVSISNIAIGAILIYSIRVVYRLGSKNNNDMSIYDKTVSERYLNYNVKKVMRYSMFSGILIIVLSLLFNVYFGYKAAFMILSMLWMCNLFIMAVPNAYKAGMCSK